MNNAKIAYFLDTLKHTFSLKKTKVTLYMVAVLWLAVATQIATNKIFREEFKITDAFVKTNAEEMQSRIEVIAEYNDGLLSEADKENIIISLADAIGLKIDGDISLKQNGNRTEYYYVKKAKQAETEIKVVSLEKEEDSAIKIKHYIIIRLNISDSIQSMDRYKNMISDTLVKLGVKNKQFTMQFEGSYDGLLSLEEKDQVTALLVDELQGEIALEYKEKDLYTVYAYTGLINEYIVSMGSKVNVQIAITYNELKNKTFVTMATPILNRNW